ncbi:MAG: TrmO family methyltransferase [Desulfobacterales bacterium]
MISKWCRFWTQNPMVCLPPGPRNSPTPSGCRLSGWFGAENRMRVENIDVLDQTRFLDIKPYVPQFDAPETNSLAPVRTGWLETVRKQTSAENPMTGSAARKG